jgi:hypothetical protein
MFALLGQVKFISFTSSLLRYSVAQLCFSIFVYKFKRVEIT